MGRGIGRSRNRRRTGLELHDQPFWAVHISEVHLQGWADEKYLPIAASLTGIALVFRHLDSEFEKIHR